MSREEFLEESYQAVRRRISQACERAGREPREVTLVAVSKTHPASDIRTLYEMGHRDFGENYVQEWDDKRGFLPDDIRWHFVGHLQSNKARYLADQVHLVHSVDRKSVMKELNKRSDSTVEVLIQVNTGNDLAKGGVDPGDTTGLLTRLVEKYPRLKPCGVMTIPPFDEPIETTRQHFATLRGVFEQCQEALVQADSEFVDGFEHISMGMTSDFEVAIEEGATLVRVGTALFGERRT